MGERLTSFKYHTKATQDREVNWNIFITIMVKTLEKNPNILQPHISWHMKVNPTLGAKTFVSLLVWKKKAGRCMERALLREDQIWLPI